jgi:hypothetical protein
MVPIYASLSTKATFDHLTCKKHKRIAIETCEPSKSNSNLPRIGLYSHFDFGSCLATLFFCHYHQKQRIFSKMNSFPWHGGL